MFCLESGGICGLQSHDLSFVKIFFCKYKDLEALDVSRIITEVLFLHNGPIYKFILFTTSSFLGFKSGYLIRWILFLSRKGVKNIQLVNDRYYIYRMPSHLFSCQELTHVWICKFKFLVPPNLCGFKCLLHLHLECIRFEFGPLESYFWLLITSRALHCTMFWLWMCWFICSYSHGLPHTM